jgi:hypothetical protein
MGMLRDTPRERHASLKRWLATFLDGLLARLPVL